MLTELVILAQAQTEDFMETHWMIFEQDGAPAHTALATHEWLQSNIPQFWDKGAWPPNSPDLSSTGNIWAIINSNPDGSKN
jgi:hypothetical protein